jgi:hypothetical protein
MKILLILTNDITVIYYIRIMANPLSLLFYNQGYALSEVTRYFEQAKSVNVFM